MVKPWKQVYDDAIVNYMREVAVVLGYKKIYSKNEKKERSFYRTYESSDIVDIDGKPVIKLVQEPQSKNDIWEAVKKAGYPKAARDTIYDHIARLEKKKILDEVLPKTGRKGHDKNKKLYQLSKLSLVRDIDTLPSALDEFISELGTLRRIFYAMDLE